MSYTVRRLRNARRGDPDQSSVSAARMRGACLRYLSVADPAFWGDVIRHTDADIKSSKYDCSDAILKDLVTVKL